MKKITKGEENLQKLMKDLDNVMGVRTEQDENEYLLRRIQALRAQAEACLTKKDNYIQRLFKNLTK